MRKFLGSLFRSEPEEEPVPVAPVAPKHVYGEAPIPDSEVVLKIVLIGGASVGKTAIIRRYLQACFTHQYLPTIGIDISTAKLQSRRDPDAEYRIQFWDVAHAEARGKHHASIFRGAVGIALVFDCCNVQSVTALDEWRHIFEETTRGSGSSSSSSSNSSHHNSLRIPMVLLANKSDVGQPVIKPTDLDTYAERGGYAVWRFTTARSGTSVAEAMDRLLDIALEFREYQMSLNRSNRRPEKLISTRSQLLPPVRTPATINLIPTTNVLRPSPAVHNDTVSTTTTTTTPSSSTSSASTSPRSTPHVIIASGPRPESSSRSTTPVVPVSTLAAKNIDNAPPGNTPSRLPVANRLTVKTDDVLDSSDFVIVGEDTDDDSSTTNNNNDHSNNVNTNVNDSEADDSSQVGSHANGDGSRRDSDAGSVLLNGSNSQRSSDAGSSITGTGSRGHHRNNSIGDTASLKSGSRPNSRPASRSGGGSSARQGEPLGGSGGVARGFVGARLIPEVSTPRGMDDKGSGDGSTDFSRYLTLNLEIRAGRSSIASITNALAVEELKLGELIGLVDDFYSGLKEDLDHLFLHVKAHRKSDLQILECQRRDEFAKLMGALRFHEYSKSYNKGNGNGNDDTANFTNSTSSSINNSTNNNGDTNAKQLTQEQVQVMLSENMKKWDQLIVNLHTEVSLNFSGGVGVSVSGAGLGDSGGVTTAEPRAVVTAVGSSIKPSHSDTMLYRYDEASLQEAGTRPATSTTPPRNSEGGTPGSGFATPPNTLGAYDDVMKQQSHSRRKMGFGFKNVGRNPGTILQLVNPSPTNFSLDSDNISSPPSPISPSSRTPSSPSTSPTDSLSPSSTSNSFSSHTTPPFYAGAGLLRTGNDRHARPPRPSPSRSYTTNPHSSSHSHRPHVRSVSLSNLHSLSSPPFPALPTHAEVSEESSSHHSTLVPSILLSPLPAGVDSASSSTVHAVSISGKTVDISDNAKTATDVTNTPPLPTTHPQAATDVLSSSYSADSTPSTSNSNLTILSSLSSPSQSMSSSPSTPPPNTAPPPASLVETPSLSLSVLPDGGS